MLSGGGAEEEEEEGEEEEEEEEADEVCWLPLTGAAEAEAVACSPPIATWKIADTNCVLFRVRRGTEI